MNNTYKTYLNNMKDYILDGKKNIVMLIRHYSYFDFDSEIDISIFKENNIDVVRYEFSHRIIDNPFEPFLGWICNMINDYIDDIDKFLDDMGVYSIHKSLFLSYLKNGICSRSEEFIDHSYLFESKCLYNALLNMIAYFSNIKPVVFALNKFHCVELSTIKLFDKIIKDDNRVYVIASYNEFYPVRRYISDEWNCLIEYMEKKEFVYDYDDMENSQEVTESSISWTLNTDEIEDIVRCLHNKTEFLEFEEAMFYLDIIYDQMNLEKLNVDDAYKFIIYKMFTESLSVAAKFHNVVTGSKINDVLLICDKMKRICEKKNNLHNKYVYCYTLSKVYMLNGQDRNALHYTNEAIKLAKKMKQQIEKESTLGYEIGYYYDCKDMKAIDYVEICIMKAEVLLLKISNDVTLYSPDRKNVPDDLIDRLRNYKYYDHLAEVLNLCCEREKDVFASVDGIEERAPMIAEAVNIGKMVGNKAFLRSFYRVNIMRASNAGYFEVANYFCKKVLEVVGDDEMQAAYTYIGMGYNCCTIEQYNVAHEYFCIALKTCYKYHDVKHIAEIMYNLGVNAMLAGKYLAAVDNFNCALNIMNKMSYSKLFACSMIKICALKALCCYREKKIYLCNVEFKKIERNIDFKPYVDKQNIFNEEKFFYYYIKGLLETDKGDYYMAEHDYEEAEFLLGEMEGIKFFCYVQLMADKIDTLKILGKQTNIDRTIKEVCEYCDEKNYNDKKGRFLRKVLGEDYITAEYSLTIKDVSYDEISELTEVERTKQLLIEKKGEEEFLTKWQNIMSNPGRTLNELIDKALNAFVYNYCVDGLVMIYEKNKKLYAITKNIEHIMSSSSVQILWDFFDKMEKEPFFMSANDKNYDEYKNMLELFNSDRIYTMFGAPFKMNNKLEYVFYAYSTIKSRKLSSEASNMQLMNAENIDVYTRLFRQLIDTIDSQEKTIQINKMNDMLKHYAHTDLLTGLLNRKGLEESLKEMFRRDREKGFSSEMSINAGARRMKAKYRFYSVMYIDLDNFKYYNDTFGHDIGDMVLKRFAEIIKQLCIDSGLAVRYGGDEFLLVYKNTDKNKITEIAEHIYECIADENSFIDIICEELNELVNIEEENRISCSIGIAGFKVMENEGMTEFAKAVDNADKALYHVKKTTKGTFAFYTK